MSSIFIKGDFSNISLGYLELAQWIEDSNSYKISGSNRQIIHKGPWNETNPNNYLTELQIPLDKI